MGRCPLLRSLALCGLVISSGCATARPDWTNGDLGPEDQCCFQYRYVLGLATRLSLTDAREAAEVSARFQAALSSAMELAGDSDIRQSAVNVDRRAALLDSITRDLQTKIIPVTIRGWELYEAYDELLDGNQGYAAWVLYRFARGADRRPPPSRLVWAAKSAVLPGWGQRARGAKARGNIFMSSFLGGGASWFLLDQLKVRAIERMDAATNAPEQRDALNKANFYGDVRNGILAALTAIWTISFADAVSGDSQLLPFRVHGAVTEGGTNFSIHVPFF